MNIDDRMIRHLKKTSIRARFAIGLTCIKKHFRNEGLQGDPSVRLIIEKYAGFTCSQKFDVWENEMEHYNTGINRVFSSGEEIRASLQKTNKVYAAYNHPGNRSAWYDGVQLPVYDEQTYDNLFMLLQHPG